VFYEIPKKKKKYVASGETNNKKNQKQIMTGLPAKNSTRVDAALSLSSEIQRTG
jgi:hypothetical protein